MKTSVKFLLLLADKYPAGLEATMRGIYGAKDEQMLVWETAGGDNYSATTFGGTNGNGITAECVLYNENFEPFDINIDDKLIIYVKGFGYVKRGTDKGTNTSWLYASAPDQQQALILDVVNKDIPNNSFQIEVNGEIARSQWFASSSTDWINVVGGGDNDITFVLEIV